MSESLRRRSKILFTNYKEQESSGLSEARGQTHPREKERVIVTFLLRWPKLTLGDHRLEGIKSIKMDSCSI